MTGTRETGDPMLQNWAIAQVPEHQIPLTAQDLKEIEEGRQSSGESRSANRSNIEDKPKQMYQLTCTKMIYEILL